MTPPTIYGVVLNDEASLHTVGPLDAAPYQGAPKAPALYIKPVNTHAASGAQVALPPGADSVEVGATVGLVLGRTASRVSAADAPDCVAGLVLAADLSLPHASYYRPAIREKCFDQSLVLSGVQPLADVAGLTLVTEIDGQQVDSRRLNDLVRPPAQLLAEISDWMTLSSGDVLLVGVRYQAPQARVGSRVRVCCSGLGAIEFTVTADTAGGQA
ncbi:fumarylacetoacetate hydrolase family protein [Comamonas nitrativorans]|uniref:Fumarylacetoacetate hydrolase family protein n=1 Tax=Comamonas nitrativorans TaxID=108437 RepID=A0ABV9GTW9_9BURK